MEEKRIAVLAIAVKDREKAMQVNELLHQFGDYIISRTGLPYREQGINIITLITDAPQDIVSNLSGKIGRISDVEIKISYLKV
ncbi:MAG: iron-only hydrogenase system regulator [Lachnospiraceae bacterium]|nr:iron-only hydrogenase system regulator [Lachnospiraceae bacterium]